MLIILTKKHLDAYRFLNLCQQHAIVSKSRVGGKLILQVWGIINREFCIAKVQKSSKMAGFMFCDIKASETLKKSGYIIKRTNLNTSASYHAS